MSLKLNLTAAPDSVRDPTVTCTLFYLWAHSNENDPQFPLFACISSKIPKPLADDTTVQKGVVIHSTKDWTVDKEFQAATGVSGHSVTSNNWLLMAQQAAIDTGDDCLVCMGARPLLKIVAAPIEPDCVWEVMMKDNPADNCSKYDAFFPLVPSSPPYIPWQSDDMDA